MPSHFMVRRLASTLAPPVALDRRMGFVPLETLKNLFFFGSPCLVWIWLLNELIWIGSGE